MTNAMSDVAVLTQIPEKTLRKVAKKIDWSICEAIQENLIADSEATITSVDIGIGTLFIKHDKTSEVKYHFEPCDYLKKAVITTVKTKTSPLDGALTEALNEKFMDAYRSLC